MVQLSKDIETNLVIQGNIATVMDRNTFAQFLPSNSNIPLTKL